MRELRANDRDADTPAGAAAGASRRPFPALLLRECCSYVFQLFFEQLLAVQVGVVAFAREQFVMGTALSDVAVAEDDDLVGVLDGGDAVRNQNCGAALHHGAEAGEDALFGLSVHSGKGIVEDEDARVANDGAGDGASLFLSAGERDAAFAERRVVLVGEFLDVGIEIGDFCGGADLVDAEFG